MVGVRQGAPRILLGRGRPGDLNGGGAQTDRSADADRDRSGRDREAQMSDLTLYNDEFWISPFAFACFVALEEKGLDYQVKTVALNRKEHRKPEYAGPSITGKIPALVHGSFWLTESSAIIEYLEDAFPGKRVLPAGAKERARARQLMSFLRTEMNPLREDRPTTVMFYEKTTRALTPPGAQAAANLLRVAEAILGDGNFVAGEWSIADA